MDTVTVGAAMSKSGRRRDVMEAGEAIPVKAVVEEAAPPSRKMWSQCQRKEVEPRGFLGPVALRKRDEEHVTSLIFGCINRTYLVTSHGSERSCKGHWYGTVVDAAEEVRRSSNVSDPGTCERVVYSCSCTARKMPDLWDGKSLGRSGTGRQVASVVKAAPMTEAVNSACGRTPTPRARSTKVHY
ncbi:hypothetical protein EI94DRAFT_1702337 [Lactarius quietus]|nr:hypothetical protein EI94DRAFT_1702337 [Lactarius quietus]